MIPRKTVWLFLPIAVAFPHMSLGQSRDLLDLLARPAFEAVCDDDHVVAFRYETDYSGKPMTHGWTEGEKERFSGPWTFVYDGGDVMLIDGKEAIVVGSNGPSVVAIQPGIAPAGAGTWSYVIHTELQMVVAAQVNGFSRGKANGVKTRSVSFQCTFMQ